MITDNYIKMCKASEEVQKLCQYKMGDWFLFPEDLFVLNCDIPKGGGIKYPYLPTLEQLFEKWCNLCQTNNWAHPEYLGGDHLPTHFIERIYKETRIRTKWFDKELCLEIIMKDFYHKAWTGEKWEVMK